MKAKLQITLVLSILMIIVFSVFAYMYQDKLYIFYRDNILKSRNNIVLKKNEYYKKDNYLYVENTDNFIVKNKKDIRNVLYTIINSGIDKFTFYCDDDYFTCTNDIDEIANDQNILSNINNFVHPYNSFKEINTSYDERGNITISINKTYSYDDIEKLNKRVDEIIKEVITDNLDNKSKIRKIHNYIINNSKYATESIVSNNPNLSVSKANGALLEGYGNCNSYADAMAIFLNKLNIKNYKIASDTHVWNLVYPDDEWLHLDLTWDDPVNSDGSDTLEVTFFLITDSRLKELAVDMHDYDSNIYLELNPNEKEA